MRTAVSTIVAVPIAVVIVIAAIAGVYLIASSTGTPIPSSTTSTRSTITSSTLSTTSSSTTSTSIPSQTNLQKVTFMLDYFPAPNHAFFYYGLSQGIFVRHGIDLTIVAGSGSGPGVAAISQDKVDFTDIDVGTVSVLARTQNITNVRMVATFTPLTPFVIIYNSRTIHSVADLNGKTLGTFQGSASTYTFAIFAKINGINLSSIKQLYTTPASFNNLVAIGKADFIITTASQLALLPPTAAQNNITLGYFSFPDYKLDLYGFGIFTTTQMISNHPDLVKSFVAATMESIVEAGQNPQAAVQAFQKYNPQQNATLQVDSFKKFVQLTIPKINSTTPTQLGRIDVTRLQFTVNAYAQAYGIKPIPVESLYTNQFVQSP